MNREVDRLDIFCNRVNKVSHKKLGVDANIAVNCFSDVFRYSQKVDSIY